MQPLEIGVVFWTGGELGVDASPAEIVQSVQSLGVKCGQLAVHGTAPLDPAPWKDAVDAAGIEVVTCFMGYEGESYASIPECARTVGYVPAATRQERGERALLVSDFAKGLGVPGIAAHIGCVPSDRSHPDYVGVRDLMRKICDRCGENGQTFALETGQEPAEELLEFLHDVGRDNLKINFDPANMILYGSGEPLDALEVVKDYVITVHCKDGTRPKAPGEWGAETPLGQGDVGMDRFIAKLKEIGYQGPLIIEREIVGDAQREDILGAVALLERLRG